VAMTLAQAIEHWNGAALGRLPATGAAAMP
jgi:hypothetical protein